MSKKINSNYVRNFVFGAEDSLVSTVGVLFGIATANSDLKLIILTGLVVISVEALSMGAGAFLSESSANEIETKSNQRENPVIDGLIMFFSYLVAGFIPLAPYFFLEIDKAMGVSVLFTLIALFFIGYLPSKKLGSAFRMVIVAGIAVFIGFLIGSGVEYYL